MTDQREKIITIAGNTKTFDVSVFEFDELDSTNDHAKMVAGERTGRPFIVRAAFQRKGRGRYKRVWVSPAGKNLLCSIVIYPGIPVSRTPLITMLAAEAMVEVLAPKVKGRISIKKPNDVLLNQKKVAGILTEQESIGAKSSFVIIGIGLNVNASADEIPPEGTSLFAAEGVSFDIDILFQEIVKAFFLKYEKED